MRMSRKAEHMGTGASLLQLAVGSCLSMRSSLLTSLPGCQRVVIIGDHSIAGSGVLLHPGLFLRTQAQFPNGLWSHASLPSAPGTQFATVEDPTRTVSVS